MAFVGKVSEGDEIEWHQHEIGHLVPYLEIQWSGVGTCSHVPWQIPSCMLL